MLGFCYQINWGRHRSRHGKSALKSAAVRKGFPEGLNLTGMNLLAHLWFNKMATIAAVLVKNATTGLLLQTEPVLFQHKLYCSSHISC